MIVKSNTYWVRYIVRLPSLCEIERNLTVSVWLRRFTSLCEIEWDKSNFERDLLFFVRLSETYLSLWDWERLSRVWDWVRPVWFWERLARLCEIEQDLPAFARLVGTCQPLWDWEGLTSLLSRTPCLSWRLGVRTHGGRHTLYLNGSHILGSCTELYFLCKPGINVIIFKSSF